MYYVYRERMRERVKGTKYHMMMPTDLAVQDWLRCGRDLSEYHRREEFSEVSHYGATDHK